MAKSPHVPPAQGTFQEQPRRWEHPQVSKHGTVTSQHPDIKPFPWDEGRQKSLWSCPGMLSCLPELLSCLATADAITRKSKSTGTE